MYRYKDTYFIEIMLKGINSRSSKNACMRTYMFHMKHWYFINGGGVYHNIQECRMREHFYVGEDKVLERWSEEVRDEVEHYIHRDGTILITNENILSMLTKEFREKRFRNILSKPISLQNEKKVSL